MFTNYKPIETIASLDNMQLPGPVLSEQYLPILVTIYTNT